MRRRLFTVPSAQFTIVSGLSLLLCLGLVALRVRAHYRSDALWWSSISDSGTSWSRHYWVVEAGAGDVYVESVVDTFGKSDPDPWRDRLEADAARGARWSWSGPGPADLASHGRQPGGAGVRAYYDRWGVQYLRESDFSRVGRYVRFPLVPLILAAALAPIAWLAAWGRRMRRASPAAAGFCPSCGYDLRATPDRCPECGSPAPSERPDLRIA